MSASPAQPFGSCCPDLKKAMSLEATRLLRVEDNGVLYLSVGAAETPDGIGWLDAAVFYCPFCGTSLQTRESIAKAPRL
jgi:hypothetical protein